MAIKFLSKIDKQMLTTPRHFRPTSISFNYTEQPLLMGHFFIIGPPNDSGKRGGIKNVSVTPSFINHLLWHRDCSGRPQITFHLLNKRSAGVDKISWPFRAFLCCPTLLATTNDKILGRKIAFRVKRETIQKILICCPLKSLDYVLYHWGKIVFLIMHFNYC